MNNRMTYTSERALAKIELIKQLLAERIMSSRDIQERTNFNESTVRKYLRYLIAAKEIHVAGQRQVFAAIVPIYGMGEFPTQPMRFEEDPAKRINYPRIPTERGTDWVTNWIPVREVA